jgi:Fe-S-cluster-containing dehydrogenase component/formate-dependent nitrite reductase membrane component NrfD
VRLPAEVAAIQFGFLIDNRKCIGCHACTVACKSEHDVPIGVNRTWVKQVEHGTFPEVRRSFHVMRCNHCADAPCTEICPVTALYTRADGIVDFDNDRCIGCKACMQACPYDALYIDPNTHTAAKCNFCAHRVDRGLLPACVVACPEQAIVTGDLTEPTSAISRLVAREAVQVRRPEKGTKPSLYYIDGDRAALDPQATSGTSRCTTTDALDVRPLAALGVPGAQGPLGRDINRRVYDAPKNGVLWGWEVSGYLVTKALAAGVLLVPLFAVIVLDRAMPVGLLLGALIVSLAMQLATGALLVGDLERPDRFLNVILRGNPRSWLVRGAWILTAFGAATVALLVALLARVDGLMQPLAWLVMVLTLPTAGYTAFLLAQAKGRDLWQSPLQPLHMLVHAVIAGAAATLLLAAACDGAEAMTELARMTLVGGLLVDLGLVWAEIAVPHPTAAAAEAAHRLHTGAFAARFWIGVIGGSLLACLLAGVGQAPLWAAVLALGVLWVRNDLWVRAPQMVSLS